MAETIIYGPQTFTAGTFSTSGFASDVHRSSTFGGPDAPISGYPEFVYLERVERVLSAGPSGENVCDARVVDGPPDEFDLAVAGMHCCAYGSLTGGQFDCRGPLHVRMQQFLDSSILTDTQFCAPFYLFHGGSTGSSASFATGTGGQICGVEMVGSGGANFNWGLYYRRNNGATAGTSTQVAGSADVADDAWHEIELIITPATVTGAFNGAGGTGSASVASDGSISVLVDSVEVVAVSSAKVVINFLATTNPAVYYAFGHKHGDF